MSTAIRSADPIPAIHEVLWHTARIKPPAKNASAPRPLLANLSDCGMRRVMRQLEIRWC